MIGWGGHWHPSLALAAVWRVAPPVRWSSAIAPTAGCASTSTAATCRSRPGRPCACATAGRAARIHTWSAADVLAGAVPAASLAGRVVFVGATGLGVRDTVATAMDTAFPGIEVHATIADTLLGGGGASRPGVAWLVEMLAAIAVALLVAGASRRFAAAGGAAAAGVAAIGAWLAARAAFAAAGLLFSPVPALLAAVAALAVETGAVAWAERRRADDEADRRQRAQRLVIQALTSLTETRDRETGLHVRRTQDYTRLLAQAVSARARYRAVLPAAQVELIATLAPLHDIGKVGVPDAVLNKPGRLTAEERREIERHPTIGYEALARAERAAGVLDDEVLAVAKDIVYTHHERWDGRGYPRGLAGEAIPLAGRIVAVVDAFDAMRSDRVYRAALPHEDAVAELTRSAGTHFDPEVVAAFRDVEDQFARLASHHQEPAPGMAVPP